MERSLDRLEQVTKAVITGKAAGPVNSVPHRRSEPRTADHRSVADKCVTAGSLDRRGGLWESATAAADDGCYNAIMSRDRRSR